MNVYTQSLEFPPKSQSSIELIATKIFGETISKPLLVKDQKFIGDMRTLLV